MKRTRSIRKVVSLSLISLFGGGVLRAASLNETRIQWQGKPWMIVGANVAWYNWGQDFGGGVNNGGVSGNKTALGQGFQKMKDSGVHVARWWVFPGDPWQITRDANGPTGLNPAIYADFDAALELAETYDLYYNFVLFSAATSMPSSWLTNATQRAKLAQALTPLFARYKDNPRVLSWEIYNEPEFQIWNNEIDEASAVAAAKAITDAVHANSPALVTIGHAFVDGIPMWKSVGLDYYSPHWYDYMSSGDFCLRCHDYDYYKGKIGLDKPLVVGEFFTSTGQDAVQRYEDFRAKGYAGAWGWTVFWDKTNDKMQIDWTATETFSSRYSDIGPKGGAAPAGKTGDLNGDNQVDVTDLSILTQPTKWNSSDPVADINGDGIVDVVDLSILLRNWGT